MVNERPLHGSTTAVDSPTKIGLDPDGSPTNVAFVTRSMKLLKSCAAENVSRPMITNTRFSGSLSF